MEQPTCPICGEGVLHVRSEERTITDRGMTAAYHFQHSVCDYCESDLITPKQLQANQREVVAAKRRLVDAPSPDALRAWRQKWGLKQRDAGLLTGVGPVAFSEYENSALSPSAPTARLLHTLIASDEAVEQLARRYEVPLRKRHIRPSTAVNRSSKLWMMASSVSGAPLVISSKVAPESDTTSWLIQEWVQRSTTSTLSIQLSPTPGEDYVSYH